MKSMLRFGVAVAVAALGASLLADEGMWRLDQLPLDVIAQKYGVRLTPHILAGHPGAVIPRLAREIGADLVVAGFHGHSALHERLFGSTCLEIMVHSPCDVLVVK